MHILLPFIAINSLVGASVIQHVLIDPSKSETPLINSHDSKPLVTSEALEAHIKAENLLKRAEKLFKIAEEGIEEYNHPTRVIGSKGKIELPVYDWLPY
jgi:aminopeptidase Y